MLLNLVNVLLSELYFHCLLYLKFCAKITILSITKDKIYLFVDGRYHTQADNEVNKDVTVVKLQLGQKQDDEIKKLIELDKTLGIVAKKVSQKRLESFNDFNVVLASITRVLITAF